MSIELVRKGKCKDCYAMKLKIDFIDGFYGVIADIKCEHEQACRRAWQLGYEEAVEDMNK